MAHAQNAWRKRMFGIMVKTGSQAIPRLTSIVKNSKTENQTRIWAAKALAAIGGEANQSLKNMLANGDWTTRLLAVKTMGRIHTDSSVDVLIGALRDNDERVRIPAARALVNLGEIAVGPLKATTTKSHFRRSNRLVKSIIKAIMKRKQEARS